MIYSLTLSAGYQCRASPLRIYLPLPCFVVLQLDLSMFFLCQLAQYIKLCQLGHYSMNWFLFLVLVCFFLLVPVVCGTPRRAHHFATFSGTSEMVAS